jgi:pilus assembly protein Flp/PilA
MLSKVKEALVALVSRFEHEDGQALAEYGLLLALIVVVCVLAVTALGLAIGGILGSVSGTL